METPRSLSVRHWNLLNLFGSGEYTSHDIRAAHKIACDRSISYGGVYVEMHRLCEKGLVQFRCTEDADGSRRIFSLTDLGQATLRDAPWIRHW